MENVSAATSCIENGKYNELMSGLQRVKELSKMFIS